MKKLMLVLLVCSISYALNAPYLISATALSDNSVALTWRNNDIATEGFIILRKDSTGTVFNIVDSIKSSIALSCITKSLLPLTLYAFQLRAYNTAEVSDTSNSMQVTTLARTTIFNQPSVSVYWNYDTSTLTRVRISDNANCETGYRIYRDVGFASSFNLIAQITSANPEHMDSIIWYDNTVSFNTWYSYKVVAYTSNDSIFSNPCSTFTFQAIRPQQVVKFQKLSDFPVSDSGSWSARAGDSIILKENPPSPAGMFSVINVSNPANPSFAGYIDSATARSYPLQTLVPPYLNFGVYNSYIKTNVITYQDRVLVLKGTFLRMYQIQDTNLVLIDSYIVSTNLENRIFLLSDTLLAVLYFKTIHAVNSYDYDTIFFYPVHLSSSGFSSSPGYIIGIAYYLYWGDSKRYIRPYIQGSYDNKILIPVDVCSVAPAWGSSTPWCYLMIVDNSSNRNVVLPDSTPFTPYANAYNTGYYLSPTENLCTNAHRIFTSPQGAIYPTDTATELFVSCVGDPHPYTTAQSHNAIYRDDIHRQNTLQNILLDTLNNRVFLLFNNNMTILGYQSTGVITHPNKLPSSKGLVILSSSHISGVTIILPAHSRSSNLYFYDLSGRVVDRMLGVTSNAVLWRPKTKSMGCYFVMVKNSGEKYTAKFMVR